MGPQGAGFPAKQLQPLRHAEHAQHSKAKHSKAWLCCPISGPHLERRVAQQVKAGTGEQHVDGIVTGQQGRHARRQPHPAPWRPPRLLALLLRSCGRVPRRRGGPCLIWACCLCLGPQSHRLGGRGGRQWPRRWRQSLRLPLVACCPALLRCCSLLRAQAWPPQRRARKRAGPLQLGSVLQARRLGGSPPCCCGLLPGTTSQLLGWGRGAPQAAQLVLNRACLGSRLAAAAAAPRAVAPAGRRHSVALVSHGLWEEQMVNFCQAKDNTNSLFQRQSQARAARHSPLGGGGHSLGDGGRHGDAARLHPPRVYQRLQAGQLGLLCRPRSTSGCMAARGEGNKGH